MPESRRGRGRDYTSVVADQYRCLTTVDDGVGELFKSWKLRINGIMPLLLILATTKY